MTIGKGDVLYFPVSFLSNQPYWCNIKNNKKGMFYVEVSTCTKNGTMISCGDRN